MLGFGYLDVDPRAAARTELVLEVDLVRLRVRARVRVRVLVRVLVRVGSGISVKARAGFR